MSCDYDGDGELVVVVVVVIVMTVMMIGIVHPMLQADDEDGHQNKLECLSVTSHNASLLMMIS